MNIWVIVLILLLLGAFGSWPSWPHQGYGLGYWPSGGFGVILLILLVLLLVG